MSDPSMSTVRRRFEREAADFDAIYRLERSPFWRWFNTTFRKGIFQRYDITFAESGDVTGKSVLDIGCGSGVYCVDFARRGAARVVGLDFSGAMLEIARREAAENGVADVCDFVQADFREADLQQRFDISIAMGVFDYLPDPLPFLRKMVSVTTDRVIISFPGHSRFRERARRWRYRLSGKGDVFFYTEDEVRGLALDSGLARHHIVPIHSSGTGFVLVGSPETG